MSAQHASARAVAANVLLRVEKERAFAAAALSSALDHDLNLLPADRALCTELCYGVLRVRLGLLAELGRLLDRGSPDDLEPLARTHLLLALYQLLFLDRVPAFAATNEAVSLVSQERGKRMGGLVNALLRRYLREALRDERRKEQARTRVGWASAPPWLRKSLVKSLGDAPARAFLTDALQVPPSAIAVLDPSQRDHWISDYRAALPQAELSVSAWSPRGVRIAGPAKLGELEGEGERFYVQEEGSQAIAHALDVRPGERVLDVCAGRGQKTALLAAMLRGEGQLVATDLYPAKLEELRARFERLGLPLPHTTAVDWSRGAGALEGAFDAILVDAPCTGIGTLRRRPDLLQRRSPDDLERLPALQLTIARHAAQLLAPGGRLLYAVCSIHEEEGPAVVEALCQERPELQAESMARLTPLTHGTDGYFFALLRRAD